MWWGAPRQKVVECPYSRDRFHIEQFELHSARRDLGGVSRQLFAHIWQNRDSYTNLWKDCLSEILVRCMIFFSVAFSKQCLHWRTSTDPSMRLFQKTGPPSEWRTPCKMLLLMLCSLTTSSNVSYSNKKKLFQCIIFIIYRVFSYSTFLSQLSPFLLSPAPDFV